MRGNKQLVVVGDDGERRDAAVVKRFDGDDLVVLRVSSPPQSGLATATFAAAAPVKPDIVSIVGFWGNGVEPDRGWSFFGPERPKYIASVQEKQGPVNGVVEASGGSGLVLLASVGRGAYGGIAVNKCGRIVGMVRRGSGKSEDDLWEPHTIEPRVALATADRLIALLKEAGVSPAVAAKNCSAEVATKSEKEKKQAALAEKQRKEAEQKAKEAEKKAAAAEKGKADAEKTAEQAKQDAVTAVDGLTQQVDAKEQALEAERERRRLYVIYGSAGGAALLLVCFFIWAKRRKDLKGAEAEIESANARFNDCLLEGTDSTGGPIALRLSGRDLLKSANGLVFGRNPDLADVVVADETVSRRHARAIIRDGAIYIEDLASTGGTRVNGHALNTESGPLKINTDDVVEMGGVKMTMRILEG